MDEIDDTRIRPKLRRFEQKQANAIQPEVRDDQPASDYLSCVVFGIIDVGLCIINVQFLSKIVHNWADIISRLSMAVPEYGA